MIIKWKEIIIIPLKYITDLETPELIAKKASEKVLKKIGSKKPPTGKFPIIFEPRVAKSILRHVASALNGSSIVSKTSFLKMTWIN